MLFTLVSRFGHQHTEEDQSSSRNASQHQEGDIRPRVFGGCPAVAATRTAFEKGGSLVPMLAFMFASTNLVFELGIVLWLLTGLRFVLAEGVGAFLLIGVMWPLVRLTLPKGLEQEVRDYEEEDETSLCHVTVVPEVYAKIGPVIFGGGLVVVTGRAEKRGEGTNLLAEEVTTFC